MEEPRTAQICRQMNEVRSHLGDEMDEIVDSARTLTDWRYYVREYPWLCLSTALAIGFLAVPRRARVVAGPSAEVLERLVQQNAANPKPTMAGGIAGAVVSLLATAAARGAAGYLAQHASRWLETASTDLRGNDEKPDHRRAAGRGPVE
jgi:hypothetical protein